MCSLSRMPSRACQELDESSLADVEGITAKIVAVPLDQVVDWARLGRSQGGVGPHSYLEDMRGN
jgi:hypothetical protein